ncbi:hypothetical protein ACA910_010038 [Epithemia clementina (nom. ined.)]
MDPGWFVLFIFFMCEATVATLLVLPVPNNRVRGAIRDFVGNLWEQKPIQGFVFAMLALDLFYFWFVFDALLHPLHDFGIIRNPAFEGGITCEAKQNLFYNERNAYLTGMSMFLFIIINRLVDIQDKLHAARNRVKELEGNKKDS